MDKTMRNTLTATAVVLAAFSALGGNGGPETERPELDEITSALVRAYQRNPTRENFEILRAQKELDYDEVVASKQAKLDSLIAEGARQWLIDEHTEIVEDVVANREEYITQSMIRLTDPNMKPGYRTNFVDGAYLRIIGGSAVSCIGYTEVTVSEFSRFREISGEPDHPAVNVSLADAQAYCDWLTANDNPSNYVYRLPTQIEWEMAAGHMARDCARNCTNAVGHLTAVDAYPQTIAACGAIDMWGNCWEWTATVCSNGLGMAVKGGAFDCSSPLECRTEDRYYWRDPAQGYPNVGFRVVRDFPATVVDPSVRSVAGNPEYLQVVSTVDGVAYDVTRAMTVAYNRKTDRTTIALNPEGFVPVDRDIVWVRPEFAPGKSFCRDETGVEANVRTIPGLTYSLLRDTELTFDSENLTSLPATTASGTVTNLRDDCPPTGRAFYRVVVEN